jgi:phosphoribosylanthranilate isomerase
MTLIVKICGLSTEETLDAALDAGADMVGLNFFPRSPRFVSLDVGKQLADRARGRADIVSLTVDVEGSGLAEIIETVKPDWLQLHGNESADAVDAIRKTFGFGIRVMKALPIATRADLERAPRYAAVADRLLLDAQPPKGADRPGGHGRTFDWTILRGYVPPRPYLLSGGLTPGNVAEAIRVTGAPGVDVSSGVETAPGRKDPDLIRAFVAAARRAALMPEKAAS